LSQSIRDRDLIRLHWPVELRPAFDALFGIDEAMADVVVKAREPQLAAIKLAWWREQLQALDVTPPPAEPRLQAAARELLPRGIGGRDLAALEDGWLAVLGGAVTDEAGDRGPALFEVGRRLLSTEDFALHPHGRAWAFADLARRTGSGNWLERIPLDLASSPRRLRPLTALTALALRDRRRGFPLEQEATPGRSWILLRHRWTGRV
jgi:phytoene synthase